MNQENLKKKKCSLFEYWVKTRTVKQQWKYKNDAAKSVGEPVFVYYRFQKANTRSHCGESQMKTRQQKMTAQNIYLRIYLR